MNEATICVLIWSAVLCTAIALYVFWRSTRRRPSIYAKDIEQLLQKKEAAITAQDFRTAFEIDQLIKTLKGAALRHKMNQGSK